MSYEAFLKKHGISLPKQETYAEFLHNNFVQPYFEDANNLINDFNKISIPDISKYGDYSSNVSDYGNISLRADQLRNKIEQLKKIGYVEEYNKLLEAIDSIKWSADRNRYKLQDINSFYSSFEDENQYKRWETDNRLYAENGDLTPENVDYFIDSMEKRKAKRELNGYEQEFYDWIKNYDLTHGYKDEEYYNKRLKQLEASKKQLEALKKTAGYFAKEVWDKITMNDAKRATERPEIDRQLRDIEGRIGDMTSLRNQYTTENVFTEKGYSKYLEAEDFYSKYNIGKTAVNESIDNRGEQFAKEIWDKITMNDAKRATERHESIALTSRMEKYLTEDEKKVYYYLLGNGEKSDEFKAYRKDMINASNQRWNEDIAKDIDSLMNFDTVGGAIATIGFNLLSVPANVIGGGIALTSATLDLLGGNKIDVNNSGFFLTNFAQSVRSSTGDMIDSAGWNLVYNAVMSTADSLFAAGVFGKAAPFVLAGSAAASRMKELVLQGASDVEIVVGSLASGLIEVVTEKISIDRLFDGDIKPTTFKQLFAEGLKQATIEGSEEIASEVLNRLSDEMLRGSMSDYNQAIRRYEAEGLSKSEATKKAANDVLVQMAEALLSGMISGGIGGSVAGGRQMHKFNVIGSNIIKGNNVDTVLMAAEYMGSLDPEIKGQVEALKNYNKTGKNGKTNAAYKRTLGKVAATVAQNVTEVKQSVTEKAVSNELKSRGVDAKTVNKVSKIVSKFLSGQKLSSSEQGYLQHNSVAATVMQEIKVAQEQVKAQAVASSPTNVTQSTQVDGAVSSTSQSSAPQWAVDLVQKLTTIDSARSVINLAVKGKSAEDTHNSEVNRMIKILSIASGKTTAEQEAEAGDIPYSQYIKEKEAAAKKENTAENGGEVENTETKIMKSFGITKLNDTLHVQKKVLETLESENFWENKEERSTTVVNNDSEMNIEINESGIEETFSYKHFTRLPKVVKIKKLITVRKLPQIIQKGTLVSDNVENYHDKKSSVKYAYIECAVEIDGEPSVITVAIRKSSQKNKFWVHQVDIKQDAGSTPAGTSESSKTGYPTSDTTVIISSDEFVVNKNVTEDMSVDSDFNGFSEVDVSEDGVTYESRLLHTMRGEKITTEGQAYIKKICKNLGIEVVFENVLTPKGKHADGYIDDNGIIHIDYHCSNPVEFVLKHELTHYGESSALYSNFCKAVISSEAFAEWINSKVDGDANVTIKTAEYREQVSRLYEKNGVKLSPAKQQSEMIANFVGEVLFSRDTNGLERLTTNMPAKAKRSVIDFIKDFIAHIKEKLTKVKGVSSEILRLERKFNQLISTAEQNKTADEGGVKYSFSPYSQHEIQNWENSKRIILYENDAQFLNFIDNAISEDNNQKMYFGKVSSELAELIYKGTGINVENYNCSLSAYEIRKIKKDHGNAETEAKRGQRAITEKDILNFPNVILSPDSIELSPKQYNGKPVINFIKTTNEKITISAVVSDKRLDLFVQTAFINVKKGNLATPIAEQAAINTPEANSGTVSNNSVPQNDTTVNSNSMQEAENNSLALKENVSENEETITPESFSIPTETTEDISSSEADITEIPDLMAVIADRYKRGELTDEEYRIEVQDLLMRANEKYGPIKQGEKAENKTQIPQRVTSDKSKKTKRFVRTVHESGILSEDMEVELDARILKDMESYQIIGDKAAQRQANLAIERGTAAKEWEAAVNGDGRVGKREIAIGETLLKLAAERKDSRAVMKLIAEVSEMGTRAGQIVQAMSMLKRMDGVGQLYYVQKCVERINRDLDKRFARKVKKGKLESIPQVKINETLANQLAASKTQQDFEVTYEAMMQSIADQVPTTFLDKWNAWRYFAMLFNPRTHIRNFGGNLSNLPTVRFKDLLAASIEKIVLGEEQRTKSVVVKKEYQKFAEEDYPEIEAIITGGGKMNPSDEIRDRQNVFDTKWLEKLRKWNFDLLEKEDAHFLKKHYAHALGGFLQARNIDITKDIDPAVMEEARKYAMVEAQKATYRDASAIADILQRASRTKSQVWNSFVEGVLPFKKTPINIVRRGIEYSPIGLIKTLTKGTIDLKNEKISASQYIDGIAGGLTGTGIVLLGMLLSSLGFIKITGGFDDDEEDDLNRLLGRQEYAVEIGGASYTIDWMAPVCIPFFMGVEIQKALEEEGNGNLLNSVKNVAGNALEPIINLSMLSGMQDVISSAKYSEGSAVVGSVLWNIVLSYGSQAVPSIFGATARTIDGTRRTTYIDKTSWMSDMGQMAIGKLESKFPFASMLRSEYVDEFGRTEDNGNIFVRAIQNFISPGYYSKIEDDPVIEQLKELYEETGEGVLPSKPKKYIDVGGEKKHLTADEYEEYAKEVGQERYEYLEEFFGSSNAKNLTAEEKREVISNLYSYAQAKGKTRYSEYKLPDLYKKVYEAEKNGVSPVDYYLSKIATSVENADTDGSGTVTKKERLAAIRKMNVSNDIKAALIALYS